MPHGKTKPFTKEHSALTTASHTGNGRDTGAHSTSGRSQAAGDAHANGGAPQGHQGKNQQKGQHKHK